MCVLDHVVYDSLVIVVRAIVPFCTPRQSFFVGVLKSENDRQGQCSHLITIAIIKPTTMRKEEATLVNEIDEVDHPTLRAPRYAVDLPM